MDAVFEAVADARATLEQDEQAAHDAVSARFSHRAKVLEEIDGKLRGLVDLEDAEADPVVPVEETPEDSEPKSPEPDNEESSSEPESVDDDELAAAILYYVGEMSPNPVGMNEIIGVHPGYKEYLVRNQVAELVDLGRLEKAGAGRSTAYGIAGVEKPEPDTAADQVLAVLQKAGDSMSFPRIYSKLEDEVSAPDIRAALVDLENEGRVRRIRETNNTHTYEATKRGGNAE